MAKMIAVIGANFGDEAKGLAVDYLTRKHSAKLVAKGNGGAQAGHTVVTDDDRHVFSQLGSGTFSDARTYLGENFILSPELLLMEQDEVGYRWEVFCHPRSRVTTDFDVAINSAIEAARGSNRHGSCAMGINETVTRSQAGFKLDLEDLTRGKAYSKLIDIFNKWVPARLQALDLRLDQIPEPFKRTLTSPDLLTISQQLHHAARLTTTLNSPTVEGTVIYEGAQGLALDEHLGEFPHVTRSVTGLPSAIKVAHELGLTEVQPVYVTRAYATRHGAGPLPHEGEEISQGGKIQELTNKTGLWQGEFRFAPLDMKHIQELIYKDLQRSESIALFFGIKILPAQLFVSCMDQLGETVNFYNLHGDLETVQTAKFLSEFDSMWFPTVKYTSYGPKASDVREP